MKIKALLFMFLIVGLGSCLKDSETFVPNDQIGNIDNLLSEVKKSTSKEVTIDAGSDNTIITENLDIIIVPANVLVDKNNNPVEGKVVLKYLIDKTNGRSILNKRANAINGSPLSNYFTFEISFQQNATNLQIDGNSEGVDVMVPFDNSSDNQHLSAYHYNNSEYLDKTHEVTISPSNWKLETQSGTIFGSGFKVIVKSEGDWLIGEKAKPFEKGSLCIELPENYSNKNSIAYAFFPDKKILFELDKSDHGFCSDQLPLDNFAKIITLSEQDKTYYVGSTEIKIEKESQKINVVPTKNTIAQILELLKTY